MARSEIGEKRGGAGGRNGERTTRGLSWSVDRGKKEGIPVGIGGDPGPGCPRGGDLCGS